MKTITIVKVIDMSITSQSFLLTLYFIVVVVVVLFVVRPLNMQSTLLTNFKVHNTVLLTTDAMFSVAL